MMLRTPVCSYPIIVSHLSFNFLCLLLLYSIYLNGEDKSTATLLLIINDLQFLQMPIRTWRICMCTMYIIWILMHKVEQD
jgi:hypothetical protein